MPYPQFDRSRLKLFPLSKRRNLVPISDLVAPDVPVDFSHPDLDVLVERIRTARENDRSVILSFGAHVVKQGLSPVLVALAEAGWVTLLATNGASSIHDFELALQGATSESVPENIMNGSFGLWDGSGQLNDLIVAGSHDGLGYGEAVGRGIAEGNFPHRDRSLFARVYKAGVPLTVHIGIGYDIIHEHPNFDAAAAGAASYRDFLAYCHQVENLEGGVFVNFGSAVMGPEIYLKALSMARNVASREGREIRNFTTAVVDLLDLGDDIHTEPTKANPAYFFRPFKTILVRTVADGGDSYYLRARHQEVLPALWQKPGPI